MIYKLSIGFIALILAIVIISNIAIDPYLEVELLIILFSILFILIGIESITSSFIMQAYPRWYRFILLSIGVITILSSILALIFVFIDFSIVIALTTILLLSNGLIRIIFGIMRTEN